MSLIRNCMLILLMTVPAWTNGASGEELKYEFYQDDSSYSFHGRFLVDAELPCLKNIVYDFEHVRNYSSGAKNINLIRRGDNWNEISYSYRRFIFFENQSTWHRIFYPERNELVFKMMSSENNLNIMPDMISSSGYYRIIPAGNAHRIEYFQECRLNTDHIKDSYIRMVKKEAIEFLNEFREYIEETCLTGGL